MKIKMDQQHVQTSIVNVVNKTMQMDLTWDWPCGVAYYGVAQAYESTGNEEILRLLKNRVDEHISLGLPNWTINTCAMGHCLLTLYKESEEKVYLEIIKDKIDYLSNLAFRFGDNVLQHTVSIKNDFPGQAWADTLFMAAYFMLRTGVMLEDNELINDALSQYYWHIRYLQDKNKSLWYHGYNSVEDNHMSGFYWARANAWAAYTMSQVKRVLPQPYLYPPYMDIDCSLRDQLSALRQLQTEGGLWHTVVDDQDSYEELSASCGIAAAMLNNGNRLHTACSQRACDGIMKNITEDGRLLNVSGGTAVMNDLEGYRNISRDWTQGWGQGLALAYLVALLKHIDNETDDRSAGSK